MRNNINIKSDKNIVFQGNTNSKIDIKSKNKVSSGKQIYAFIGVVIAFLGLIATIIISWDNIINFFCK